MLCRDTSAGWSAGLRRLEFLAIGDPSANLFYDLPKSCSHWNLYESCILNLAAQGKYFCSLGLLCSHGREPLRPIQDDLRNICQRLYVIQDRRLLEQSLKRREWRTRSWFSSVSFDRSHKRGLLAAYECACSKTDINIKIKSGFKNILSQQSILSGLTDRDLQTFHRDWILCTNIDISLGRADRISCDRHCFQYDMRIAFQYGTVHERSRVALVSVAADILLICLVCRRKFPLQASRESCPATTAKSAVQNHLDNLFRLHRGKNRAKRFISARTDIFLDILRIDHAAVAKRDSVLLLIKLGLLKRKHLFILNRILIQEPGYNPAL